MNRLPTTNSKTPIWKYDISNIGRNLFLTDSIFDGMSDFFSDVKFPKYNVLRKGNDLTIEVALAGYKKDDISIELSPDNVLSVSSGEEEESVVDDESESDYTYIHHGVASRKFKIGWKVSPSLEVGTITYENGMLRIPLKSTAPEKPKTKVLSIK